LPTVLDVKENPKQLQIIEIEAPQLTRSLDDPQIEVAIINTDYSSQINLSPTRDGLFMEDKESPHVNIILSRVANKNANNVKTCVKALQTDETVAKADEIFKVVAVKGW